MPNSICSGECSGKYMKLALGFAGFCGHPVSTEGLRWCGTCAIANNCCQFCGKQHAPDKQIITLFFCSSRKLSSRAL